MKSLQTSQPIPVANTRLNNRDVLVDPDFQVAQKSAKKTLAQDDGSMPVALREGLEDVVAGRVSGPFETADELIEHLNS